MKDLNKIKKNPHSSSALRKRKFRAITRKSIPKELPRFMISKSSGTLSKSTGMMVKDSQENIIPWIDPSLLSRSFVITIRFHRHQRFEKRLNHWSSFVEKINGINGKMLSFSKMSAAGQLRNTRKRKGVIGCYLSHVKAWKNIIDNKYEISFIMEDDINLLYSKKNKEKLDFIFTFMKNNRNCDVLYISHTARGIGGRGRVQKSDTKDIMDIIPTTSWQTLYGYAVTLEGARKLYENAFPINHAVDVYMGKMSTQRKIKAYRTRLPLCKTVFMGSDTQQIF